jgi:hypothetical protein
MVEVDDSEEYCDGYPTSLHTAATNDVSWLDVSGGCRPPATRHTKRPHSYWANTLGSVRESPKSSPSWIVTKLNSCVRDCGGNTAEFVRYGLRVIQDETVQ